MRRDWGEKNSLVQCTSLKSKQRREKKNEKDGDNVTNQVANTEWSTSTILCELNFSLFAFRKCVVAVYVLFDLLPVSSFDPQPSRWTKKIKLKSERN